MSQARMARINRLVQTTLAELLSTVRDPRVSGLPFIAVTAVRTTTDLRHAKVYLSIPTDAAAQGAALEALAGACGFLRTRMGQRVKLRYTPELSFVLDETLDRAAHIEQVLHEIHSEQDAGDAEEEEQDGE